MKKTAHLSNDERTEEADKVSSRIAEILSEKALRFHPMSIFRFIVNYFREFIHIQVRWGIIILQNREKDFSYKGLSMSEKFIILLFLFLDDGKFMFWEKEIQEWQPCSLSNIWEHWDFQLRMIYLRKMHGIFEMRLFVQIIRTWKKAFMKQQSIWRLF